jgi:cell division protein FtsB
VGERQGAGSVSIQQVFTAAALALAIFILVVLAQRLTSSIVLWQQTRQLQSEIETIKASTDRLERRKIYVQTDEYIELVARRDMKMVRPGEVAVIGVPAPTPQPTDVPRDGWDPAGTR